jgi:hypothetical protein
MRVSPAAVAIVALAAALAAVIVGSQLINPARPLVVSAGFDHTAITPNADGDADVTNFAFELSRPAMISLLLTDASGQVYSIRRDQRTPSGEYSMAFSGVVDGFLLPDEELESTVERRLIPDGDYVWQFIAQEADGPESYSDSGSLSVSDADADLPLLTGFTISPTVFTPNQDGVADRVAVNAELAKEAEVIGYLIGPDGTRVYMEPRALENRSGEVGWQEFDYEGGVDLGADPPPDGTYEVVIEAQDAVGQRVSVSGELTIELGGKPRAGILGQNAGADVVFATAPYEEAYFTDVDTTGELIAMPDNPADNRLGQVVVPVGDLLIFKLVVENYGSSPIRTAGPPPGTVYGQRQLPAALGELEQDGVWRVGIECETSQTSYPYRWAVGAFNDLTQIEDPVSGDFYYYLEPGQRSTVWGAVRLTEVVRSRTTQQCWAGLIHEGVGIENNRIGARDIKIESPDLE